MGQAAERTELYSLFVDLLTQTNMRTVRTALLAGIAAISVAGFSGLAAAESHAIHTLTIQLPGGGVEQIHYTGNVAPEVSVMPGPMPIAAFAPMDPFFWPDSAFAGLRRISAAMDWEMDSLMYRSQDRAMLPGGPLNEATLKDLPLGTSSYSLVSTIGGSGFCTRSIQITSSANGGKPRVVSRTSGNCKATPSFAIPAMLLTSPQPVDRLRTVSATLSGSSPTSGAGGHMFHEASAWQHG